MLLVLVKNDKAVIKIYFLSYTKIDMSLKVKELC